MASTVGARLRLAILGVTVAAGLLAPPAMGQTSVSLAVPLTVWAAQPPVLLDAIGSWLATVNDPTAGPGQAIPDYSYWHEFIFPNSESFGQIALETFGGGKFASLVISDEEEGRVHSVRVPFSWQAGRFYFPLVYRLGDGIWGGWVYDHTAGAWSFIGAVLVPVRLSKLESTSATGVAWNGADQASCTAYPLADVVRMAPVGFVGAIQVQSHLAERQTLPGDCPGFVTEFAPDWDRYSVGVQESVASASAAANPSPAGHRELERSFLAGR
jgi:hypothetical protein